MSVTFLLGCVICKMVYLWVWDLLILLVTYDACVTCELMEDWAKDSDGMLVVNSLDEMKQYVRSVRETSHTVPILWLTWVEDASCNASQTEYLQDSIRAAVLQTSIPTIRYMVSTYADRQYTRATETPALFLTTMNETSRYSVEYSGSYHDIPGTVTHYRDWLTKWSTSKYDETVSSITLDESKPKRFATKDATLEYWQEEFTNAGSIPAPLLVVYYQPDASLCPAGAAQSSHDVTDTQLESHIFEQFAITVAGRRDRYFFYSSACQRRLHVYQPSGTLLYDYDSSSNMDVRTFLVQATADATIDFHRELTAPIAMAHTIHIVSMTQGMLDPTTCTEWKRRNLSIICMFVPATEHRLIGTLGLVSDRVVIVDAEQRVHVQPLDIPLADFVEETLFASNSNHPVHPQPDRASGGGITWIEQSGVGMPNSGIVVAIARTCGHCQRMLAILYRLEGLLDTLGWTDRFPLYVVDVTKSDMVQPYWLPTLYYNGIESPKRSFQDETEILEWVFGQMKDDQIVTLQQSM